MKSILFNNFYLLKTQGADGNENLNFYDKLVINPISEVKMVIKSKKCEQLLSLFPMTRKSQDCD